MSKRLELTKRRTMESTEQCFANLTAPCEENETTCPYFQSCTQFAIDKVMETLKATVQIESRMIA